MQKPNDSVNCWFVNQTEFENVLREDIYYSLNPHAYFRLITKTNDGIMEGYMGRFEDSEEYHNAIISRFTYFDDYTKRKPVYLTFDKTTFYKIIEIYPSKPLLLTLKRVITSSFDKNSSTNNKLEIENREQTADDKNGTGIARMVLPIHFEDYSGSEFERLAFAYLNRSTKWEKIEWLGQTGSDGGRDIWAVDKGQTYCYQCANYRSLPLKKVTDDIDKITKGNLVPDFFTVICGGPVSLKQTSAIKSYALRYGIKSPEVWTGAEFEEKLRLNAPDVLKRFVSGETFPESGEIDAGSE